MVLKTFHFYVVYAHLRMTYSQTTNTAVTGPSGIQATICVIASSDINLNECLPGHMFSAQKLNSMRC